MNTGAQAARSMIDIDIDKKNNRVFRAEVQRAVEKKQWRQ
jgi:hypothetical protein